MLLTHPPFDRTASDPPPLPLGAGCPARLLDTGAASSETNGLKNTINAKAGKVPLSFIPKPVAETIVESSDELVASTAPSLPRRCARCRKTT